MFPPRSAHLALVVLFCAPFGCDAPPSSVPDTPADTATVADARAPIDGTDAGSESVASRCQTAPDRITCPQQTLTLSTELGSRDVHYELPLGTPPSSGWPVAVLFQGSFFSSALMFEASTSDPFGAIYQTGTVKALLDAGYAVVAPETHLGGDTFWDTNVLPWSLSWSGAPDDELMHALLTAITDGTFGPLDPHRQYATGISSGGYMTSRMAVSYVGKFRALAIHSASYATCSGPLCIIPSLPNDHPPTLFLHGAEDDVVPISTMQDYRDALASDGCETQTIIDPDADHEWIMMAPHAIRAWFDAHP